MKVRRFNDNGILQMGQFIDSLTTEEPQPYPVDLLTDPRYTEIADEQIEIEKRNFTNRFEVGEYFNKKFANSEIQDLERDRALWSWLALYYFDEICDTDSDGSPKPGERARWIPEIWDFRKYYRHLLASPYRIYNTYEDKLEDALVLLYKPPYRPGDVVEQLTSRQELVTNSSIIGAATKLYVENDNKKHKYGVTSGQGSARRLADVIAQLDLTWDLYSLSTKEILELLPLEFSRFLD